MKLEILIADPDGHRGSLIQETLAGSFDCALTNDLDTAYAELARGDFWAALVAYGSRAGGSGLELVQGLRELAPRTLRLLYSREFSPALVRDAERLARVHAVLDASDAGFPITLRDTLGRLNTTLDAPALDLITVPGITEMPPWRAVSSVTRNFLAQLHDAAMGEAAVFVYGEPGSGKHLAARTLRQWRREFKSTPAGKFASTTQRSPVILINVPPLRERIPDLPLLADDILLEFRENSATPPLRLSPVALKELKHRVWRENVLELQAVLRAASGSAHRSGRGDINVEDLPPELPPLRSPSAQGKDEGQLDAVLRQIRAAGSIRGAARLELVPRANYIRLMRRLGVIRADAQPFSEDDL